MTRLLVSVEGQTEEGFINSVLSPHLSNHGFHSVTARMMGNPRARARRGGIKDWPTVRNEVIKFLREDTGRFVGIMVDYYALPDTWPSRQRARTLQHNEKALAIENALIDDLQNSGLHAEARRFLPLVMMHEFEAFLFVDGDAVSEVLGGNIATIINETRAQFGEPEKIYDSPMTAPSKRMLEIFPKYQKPLHGTAIVRQIGLNIIRSQCPHFGAWLAKVESAIGT